MYLIADKLTVTGAKLGGLKNAYIADEGNIGRILNDIQSRARMIVITHSLAKHVKKEIEKLKKMNKIIVTIPDKSGGGEDVITKMIRDVVGFELKR